MLLYEEQIMNIYVSCVFGPNPTTARAMSSDDLLPLLVFLVVKADIPNWLANLSYMQNFCLSNFAGGEFG